jgi:beta-lactamase class A
MQKNLLKSIKRLSSRTIIVGLVLTNLVSIVYCIYEINHDHFSAALTEYPLIDPNRSFIDQKHFITNIQPLRERYSDLVFNTKDAEISIYFEFLNTGANISINQDNRFVPGSLIKIPTALAVMKKIERGEWKLANRLVLFAEDKSDGFGVLYKDAVGTAYTIEELLKELLINSDTTAHKIFVRNLGNEPLVEVYRGLGLEDLLDSDYNITAKEYSRLFRSLYTSSFLNRNNSEYLLEILAETPFSNFLNSGIPSEVFFSHKIGIHEPTKTYLDSGIVYVESRPYILTVAVKVEAGKAYAEEIMQTISREAYEYITNY